MKTTFLFLALALSSLLAQDIDYARIRNGPGIKDVITNSLSVNCTAANTAGATLVVATTRVLTSATYPCDIQVSTGGKLRVAASSTAAMTGNIACPTYRQCFDTTTNSGALITFTKPPSNINPVQFGADPTGVADSLPGFNAAYAASKTLTVPKGAYTLSGSFVMNAPFSTLSCATSRSTIIQYTGTTLIDSVVHLRDGGAGYNLIENCFILGNTHSTYAFWADTANGSRFINMRTDGGIVASFYHDTGVANIIESLRVQIRAPMATLAGLSVFGSNTLTVISANIDGVVGTGANGNGCGICVVTSTAIHTLGGTSEGNTVNVYVASDAQADFYSMDNEAIPGVMYSLDDHGTSHIVGGSWLGGPFHYASTALHSTVSNAILSGVGTTVNIDAGAKGIAIENSGVDQISSIVNNGTCTTLHNNKVNNSGNQMPELIGCVGITMPGGFNRVIETAGSANNVIKGSFSPPSYVGTAPVACPAALDQSNDGMMFYIELAHSVAAASTFNFCNLGAHTIVASSLNAYQARPVNAVITLRWVYDLGLFMDMGQ